MKQMQAKPAGIIDTLAAGFGTVNRHLWIILIPFLLDLSLWLSPKVSAAPLATRAIESYRHWLQSSAIKPPGLFDDGEQSERSLEQTASQLSRVNVLGLLAWRLPSVIGPLDVREGRSTVNVPTWGQLVALLTGLMLGSLLLASAYLSALARHVTKAPLRFGSYLHRVFTNWGRLIAFSIIIIVAAAVPGTPVALLLALLGSLSPTLGLFLATLVGLGVLVVMFFLLFVDEAIFVSDLGVLQAIRRSIYIVGHYRGSALRLLVAIYVILVGSAIIWGIVSNHTVGLLVAFAANAYIVTSLVAASMIFYKERAAVLQSSQG